MSVEMRVTNGPPCWTCRHRADASRDDTAPAQVWCVHPADGSTIDAPEEERGAAPVEDNDLHHWEPGANPRGCPDWCPVID